MTDAETLRGIADWIKRNHNNPIAYNDLRRIANKLDFFASNCKEVFERCFDYDKA